MTGWTAQDNLIDVTGRTVWDVIEARAERSPDRPLLLDEHDRTLTCAQFRDLVERVAAGLAELGITRGTAVSWQLPTTIESIAVMCALARLGAHQNPIIALQRERDVFFAVRQSGAEFMIMPGVWNGFDYRAMMENGDWSDSPLPTLLTVAPGSVPLGEGATLAPPVRDPDAARWTYYSTGTTSAPKGVLHTDTTLLTAGWSYSARLRMDESFVGAIPFSAAHIGGMDMLTTMLIAGYPAVVMERFIPAEAVALFARHHVNFLGGSIAFAELLAAEQEKSATPVLPDLRIMIGGSGPTPAAAHERVTRILDMTYCPAYGMTEVPMIAVADSDDPIEILRYTDGEPLKGVQMRIADTDDPSAPPLGPGLDGEVQLRGPMVTPGYVDTALNADAFIDGWFRTGDVGHLRADGRLCLTGRIKDIIIRKGEKISAREIEELLMTHPLVQRVAVVGLPDPSRGERICAVVERIPGGADLDFEVMVDFVRSAGLSVYKIPEQLEVVDQLPSAGSLLKVSKAAIRQMFVAS